jgi:two-component system chemotaxis response regulator CheY
LVVDDSRPIRRIESDILNEIGFETQSAENGLEALKLLESSEIPDIVLVDWNMPEMDGLEFTKAVRSDDRLADLTLLMVTTETEIDQMLKALTAGVDEYLMKPFQKEALIDKLRIVGAIE